MRAVVAKFDAAKGFGFLRPADGGDDVFVHQSQIRMDGFRTLSPGQVCECDIVASAKYAGKYEAQNVVVIKD